ncbi:CDP-glycerol glycerophosphotransferase, TagB/SpsB family [Carnobacterium alterfunditum]|uniref:CDP-glycerol glycerophosphotransferase, TagB/SpsB family n=1 Tax=Carnobacterium alterfunditum TaxID=28230 RepID=A0A1N6HT96_9LACT|nr:CDP-glycerol--glycerophosphate glycerophosphotransferase [Carnobacterium alterfunditum]SIO22950.1 CDP-glycerol glycerophosphotransferase, TagB/SpsB family [Carnobacterium alterfunditum]
MDSTSNEQLLKIDQAEKQIKKLRHPSFILKKQEDDLLVTVTLTKDFPTEFKEFFILHRETGEKYPFKAIDANGEYSFSVDIRSFIKKHVPADPKEHFEFHFTLRYLIDGQEIEKDEPLSLDRFNHYESYGLTEVQDSDHHLYPYFSRKSQGFCFTVNIPVRSVRYIQDSKIDSINLKKHILTLAGTLVTKAIQINRIDTIMVGRKFGHRQIIHSDHQLTNAEDRTHLNYYDYQINLDLAECARELFFSNSNDEDFDLYFELYLNGFFDPTIIHVSNPNDANAKNDYHHFSYSFGKTTLLLAPNFTGQSNSFILSVTNFEKETFEYMKELFLVAPILRPFYSKREIWVIGETPMEAKNNSWAFFRYVRQCHPEKEIYYVIDRKSPDYAKAADLDEDHLLIFKSKKYIWTLLMAQLLITTEKPYTIMPTRNPLWLAELAAKKVVLLQNVLGSQNMKTMLEYNTKLFKADLMFVSSKTEKRYAIETLNFPEAKLSITGLPRFDELLKDGPDSAMKQQLLIFPMENESGLHYQSDTIDQMALSFISLLKNPAFSDFVQQYQLEVVTALPSSMIHYIEAFTDANCTLVLQSQEDILQLIKDSKVLITDADPIAFDFSFLLKPVLFYQPEIRNLPLEELFNSNFTYLNELPGEVTTSEENLLHLLQQIGINQFKITRKNQQKADALLYYHDTQSNQRIYEAISNLLH